jgi:hypothetical protein
VVVFEEQSSLRVDLSHFVRYGFDHPPGVAADLALVVTGVGRTPGS